MDSLQLDLICTYKMMKEDEEFRELLMSAYENIQDIGPELKGLDLAGVLGLGASVFPQIGKIVEAFKED